MYRFPFALLLAMSAAASCGLAAEPAYPQKTVKIIVPSAPGAPPDIVGRLISQKLSESFGRPVIVENRAGAGGIIGTDAVAKAAPDGYTLLLGTPAFLGISPALYASKVTYDPVTSFAPITTIATTTFMMVVNNSLPVHSVKDLVSLAKAKPGQLNYGASSIGTPSHLVMEMFKSATGVDIVGIYYIGTAQSLASLLADTVQVMVDAPASALPLVKAGKIRPLFVTSRKRDRQLPDVPSAVEAGVPDLDLLAWHGLLAPRGTPGWIVARLQDAAVKAIGTKEVIESLARLGLDPLPSTPDEFLAMLKTESVKWAAAVKMSGAKVQ